MERRYASLRVGDAVGPLRPIWNFGANTCHQPLQLRADLLSHLARIRRELGFRYIRAHNSLSDGTVTLRDDGSFDYTRLGDAIANLLRLGFKPFLELSSLPAKLARGPRTITAYRFYAEPPRDWNDWYRLVRGAIDYLAARFGKDELRTWYFEAWNEPNIPFWVGTQQEYFRLYDLAARAVKLVDPAFRFGGPATARCGWIEEFCNHVLRPSPDFGLDLPRCDFVSTHAYPSDVDFVDCDRGEVRLVNSNLMRTLFSEVRQLVDRKLGKGFPVICGEWNSSAGPYAFNHDDCNNAAFVAKTMTELMDIVDGSLYWNASDIYEEAGWHYEPFHGGYGLITVNDIPKAAYHAFRLLNEHRGQCLDARWSNPPAGVGCLASRDARTTRILLWNHVEPDATPTTVSVALAAPHVASARLVRVLPGRGSAFETWERLGKPQFANRSILEQLEAASRPVEESIDPSRPVELPPGTIAQLVLEG